MFSVESLQVSSICSFMLNKHGRKISPAFIEAKRCLHTATEWKMSTKHSHHSASDTNESSGTENILFFLRSVDMANVTDSCLCLAAWTRVAAAGKFGGLLLCYLNYICNNPMQHVKVYNHDAEYITVSLFFWLYLHSICSGGDKCLCNKQALQDS